MQISFFQLAKGSTTVKRESVMFHIKSVMHSRALNAKSASEKSSQNQTHGIQERFLKMDMETSEKMGKLFRTAYYIALNERPFTDFPELIDLQECNGLTALGDTYRNDKSGKTFITHIGGVYHDQVSSLIHQADYFLRWVY